MSQHAPYGAPERLTNVLGRVGRVAPPDAVLGRVCFLPRDRQRPLWRHVLALDVLCVSRPEEPMGSQAPEAMLLLSGDRGLPHRGKELLHRLSRQRHGLHPRTCHGMSCLPRQCPAWGCRLLLLAVPGKGSGRISIREEEVSYESNEDICPSGQ